MAIWSLPISAQDNIKNNIYFEGLGNGAFYSLNYEKLLFKDSRHKDYLRVGLGIKKDTDWSYLSPAGASNLEYNMPFMIVNESGIKKIKLEMGFGVLLGCGEPIRRLNIIDKYGEENYAFGITGSLGMRLTLEKVPMFFKLCYTPIYDIRQNFLVWLWVGLGVGYAF